MNVTVGDTVRVESEESFPADIILLASSEPEGLCYIETANLDGETNLKIKQAIPETCVLVSPNELSRLSGKIRRSSLIAVYTPTRVHLPCQLVVVRKNSLYSQINCFSEALLYAIRPGYME